MPNVIQIISDFLHTEFHGELALFASLSYLSQAVYGFYGLASVMLIRPHILQAMKFRRGKAGMGDFCHRAQNQALFLRFAPLFYAFEINSKLLAMSVFIDIIGRLWTIRESRRAEKRFQELSGAVQPRGAEMACCTNQFRGA